jgi:hypothetical protein
MISMFFIYLFRVYDFLWVDRHATYIKPRWQWTVNDRRNG